jgi:DNA repair exonuclease SbcCD nuclease subunit
MIKPHLEDISITKIVLLADVHMGAGGRQGDILWALRTTREYCKNNNITEIIILGDLFHDRQSISIEVLCDAYDFFKSCKDLGQQWIVFPGNHDMFLKYSWNVNSLRPFSDVLTIIDAVKILEIDDQRFWIVPFIYSESAYMRVLNKIEEQYEPGDVLLTHIGVKSASLNICFLLQDWSVVDFEDSKFDRVYTGHFHIRQQVGGNVWYPGSLIPFKFDEGDTEHGFYVYDIKERDHQFVNIWKTGRKLLPKETTPPQYCTFHDSLLDEKKADEVENNYIRVATTREYSPNEKDEIRSTLMSMGARRVTFMDLVKHDEVVCEDEVSEVVDMGSIFRDYVESDGKHTKDLRLNLLLKLDREIREEGDEIYIAGLE